jgi:hypothetical protein
VIIDYQEAHQLHGSHPMPGRRYQASPDFRSPLTARAQTGADLRRALAFLQPE